jgi:hypothetical protein
MLVLYKGGYIYSIKFGSWRNMMPDISTNACKVVNQYILHCLALNLSFLIKLKFIPARLQFKVLTIILRIVPSIVLTPLTKKIHKRKDHKKIKSTNWKVTFVLFAWVDPLSSHLAIDTNQTYRSASQII